MNTTSPYIIIIINILYFMIIIGIILIAYNTGKSLKKCPKQEILYKYIPRNYNIDSNYPELISYNFKDMFDNPEHIFRTTESYRNFNNLQYLINSKKA